MRAILAVSVVAMTTMTLGGCFFHHQQQVYTAPAAPPPVYKPLK